jgi:hypothetical protein
MIADVVTEWARYRGATFETMARSTALARAALIDPEVKARIAEAHRRLEARRTDNLLRRIFRPTPLFRDLEHEAERILKRSVEISSSPSSRQVR